MRDTLQDALYHAHPALFRQRTLSPTESGMGRGIECDDGWYGILDGLCTVLTAHGRQAEHPPILALQVKQKLGDLRCYVEGDCQWCRGAIEFSSAISRHVCEETGRPGLVMIRGRSFKTMAEDVGNAKGYRRLETEAGESQDGGVAPDMEDLPAGWRMIASVIVDVANRNDAGAIFRFGYAAGELRVDNPSMEQRISGAIECARAIASRTDPLTGAMWIPPIEAG